MKIVLDTNVLVSGIFFGGIPGKILEFWSRERFQVYVSPSIMQEYLEVLEVLGKRQKAMELSIQWGKLLSQICHIIPASPSRQKFSRDASDDKFIHASFEAGAEYLVTGDLDLKSLDVSFPFKIVSPGKFINYL